MFTPQDKPYIEFESGEEINNYLLLHPEVRAYMQRAGGRPKVAMVFFDEETEKICTELGYDLILPSAALREHLDSKIVTTKLGDEAGRAQRAEHPDVGRHLGRAGRRRPPRPGWVPTSCCRRRTATAVRRRSS